MMTYQTLSTYTNRAFTDPNMYLDRNSRDVRRRMRVVRKEVLQVWHKHFGELICAYCLNELDINEQDQALPKYPTIDHIIPLSRGGSLDSYDNLVVACNKCNYEKGSNLVKPIYYFMDVNGEWKINTI